MPKKPVPINHFTKTRKSVGIVRDENGRLKKTILTTFAKPPISERNSQRKIRLQNIARQKMILETERLRKNISKNSREIQKTIDDTSKIYKELTASYNRMSDALTKKNKK